MKKTLKNIIFIIFLISFFVYFFEVFLIVQNRQFVKSITINKYEDHKKNNNREFDKRSYVQIYKDLKKKNPEITILTKLSTFLEDQNLDYLPLSSFPNRKTILCNESGDYVIYDNDRHGFNNPDNEWDKSNFDFVLLGDSTVHGYCVNEKNSISGVLRILNNDKGGVINLAQSGIEPLTAYAILKEYLPSKNVKRILWFYANGDLEGLHRELNNRILNNYLSDDNFSQNIQLKKEHIEKLLLNKMKQNIENNEKKSTYVFRNYSRVINFLTLKKLRAKFSGYSDPYSDPNPINPKFLPTKEFKKILKLSDDFATQNNAKLYIIYLPHWHRYTSKNIPIETELTFNAKFVFEIAKELNIPIIDLNREVFLKHKKPLSFFPFENDGHLNEKGHAVVAETIFNKIKNLEN